MCKQKFKTKTAPTEPWSQLTLKTLLDEPSVADLLHQCQSYCFDHKSSMPHYRFSRTSLMVLLYLTISRSFTAIFPLSSIHFSIPSIRTNKSASAVLSPAISFWADEEIGQLSQHEKIFNLQGHTCSYLSINIVQSALFCQQSISIILYFSCLIRGIHAKVQRVHLILLLSLFFGQLLFESIHFRSDSDGVRNWSLAWYVLR